MFNLTSAQLIGHSASRGITNEPSVRINCVVKRTKGSEKTIGTNTLGKLNLNGSAQNTTNLCKKEVFLACDQGRWFIVQWEDIPALKDIETTKFSDKGVLSSGKFTQTLANAFGFVPTEDKPSFSLRISPNPDTTSGVRAFELTLQGATVEAEEADVDDDDDDVVSAPVSTPPVTVVTEDMAAVAETAVPTAEAEMPAFPVVEEDDSL